MTSATALPTDAIADRSTRLATTSTSAAVMYSPARVPRRDSRPKNDGKSPWLASMAVRFDEAYRVAFVELAVASSAAIAMTVNPASPSAGRAASAIAVSPYPMTSVTVRAPKTPSAIST